MGETIRNLLASVVGSTILATLISELLARRRDRYTVHRTRTEELAKLYEDALSVLDLGRRQRCRVDDSLQDRIISINTRLDLRAPEEIRTQFRKAGWALQDWAVKANRAAPEPIGVGYVLIRSGMDAEQEVADRSYPAVEEEIERLKVSMREHLAHLENQGQ